MSEANDDKRERTHLPVLPHSGKVDELRRQHEQQQEVAMSDQSPQVSEQQTPGDAMPKLERAPDAPPVTLPPAGHQNRLTPVAPERKTIEYKLLEGKIIAALKTVYDPEIPVDIYELGLIYDIEIDDERNVTIRMTLTAPACPVAGSLPGDVERRVEAIAEVKGAAVELVWDPPWSRDMMSETALLTLGML
ncbi:MAG TPA: SUF system Fe-S cluster assembly protein [Tepidisphaeraceae bacterium]